MSDLETLITRAQDRLRGRPLDWRDRFGEWWRAINWEGIFINTLLIASVCYLAAIALAVLTFVLRP